MCVHAHMCAHTQTYTEYYQYCRVSTENVGVSFNISIKVNGLTIIFFINYFLYSHGFILSIMHLPQDYLHKSMFLSSQLCMEGCMCCDLHPVFNGIDSLTSHSDCLHEYRKRLACFLLLLFQEFFFKVTFASSFFLASFTK